MQGGAIDQTLGGNLGVSGGSTFTSNSARFGGAISGGRDAYVSLADTTFTNNQGQYGGALDCYECDELLVRR